MSCTDITTLEGSDGQVCNSSTHATGYIICIEKIGSELFYQYRPQGFLKMAYDRTGSVRDVSSRLLCQSIAIYDSICVVMD